MNYTLDSLEQTKQALINKTKLEVKDALPVFIDDLSEIAYTENRYYFGVLTVGSNIDYAVLSYAGNDIISVAQDSQIIQLFQSLEVKAYVDDAGMTSRAYYYETHGRVFQGCFRGFEIIMG
jgi:hypothetical protein